MKSRSFFLFVLLGISLSTSSQTLTKVWSTTAGIKTPESALFDAKSNKIYVSNINGDPSTKDGNGFISVLNADGKMEQLKWATGLNAPKGSAIYNGKFYVADIDELVIINLKDGKIDHRVKVDNAEFLNDVTATEDGTIFVSDTKTNKIHAYVNGKMETWTEDKMIKNPNGLWVDKGKLYIGTDQILEADLKTKAIKVIVDKCGDIDGLQKLDNGQFLYSNWEGRIFITKGSESIKLLDTVTDKKNTADVSFVPVKNLVLVPTFMANSVDAYQFKP